MAIVPPGSVKIALERCDTSAFEKYSQAVFGAVIGNTFKPLGGYKDGGADGFVDADIHQDIQKPTIFFQASKEIDVEGKIRRTIARLKEFGRSPKTLHYATSREVKHIDRIQNELTEELDVNIRIYDCSYFEQRANHSEDAKAAFFQYLQPSLAFLEKAFAPSYPSSPVLKDARIVCAFLGQEVERRLGTTKTLESVCDALILWALEGTDPAKNTLMSAEEIIAKVENVVPTAKQFLRGVIEHRLKVLTKKSKGVRLVNIYAKDGKYCLPFESRQILTTHTIEDEALKASVTAGFEQRILNASGSMYGTNVVEALTGTLHRVLEIVFEKRGFDAARHFLNTEGQIEDALEARPIIEIAEEELERAGFKIAKDPYLLNVMKRVLRDIFYSSTDNERGYCARLARTYILLFTIRNTPEIINYFNTMSKTFHLYVGSDLLVRAISEFYLQPENQMTVNALKIIKQAGSRLILTEAMLEEVHSHIYASSLEYSNHYLEVDFLVDEALASQASKILIRSYYYAKLDAENPKRPKNWAQFLNNFVSPGNLTGPLSPRSLKELRDTLCNRFGMEFEARDKNDALIDKDEVAILAKKIREKRSPKKREELAENDAYMILRIDALRKKKEHVVGNPYGYRTWYLTQDSISNVAASICFKDRRGVKYVMRPEFLINYIAYNPTDENVRESLKTIFPSILGLRLGARLDAKTLTHVMDNIRKAHEVDPPRAAAIVAEHADALKSDKMRDFALKYTSTK